MRNSYSNDIREITLKKIASIILMVMSTQSYASELSGSDVTETTKGVISGFVKFSKDLVEGVDEGVDEGRKTGLSKDGALIINNTEDLNKYLEVKVLSVKKVGERGASIEVGFKSAHHEPIRIINLIESENVLVVDKEGYGTNLWSGKSNPQQITVPSKAGRKATFYFELPPESIKSIRFFGLPFDI
ncbi:hypothetical protein VAZ01S_121_00030 [Vibrio azureus NBRC 104587]|uniref:Uncharacterized protein n=1 Tax=Vibrio azureus NBRC 104587 TaxID=1219077 RepID=U3C9P6_9VIBR|nr:hypothetical protein VAZ01S_121_00030 [Vibrio azureus NBRC 104587]